MAEEEKTTLRHRPRSRSDAPSTLVDRHSADVVAKSDSVRIERLADVTLPLVLQDEVGSATTSPPVVQSNVSSAEVSAAALDTTLLDTEGSAPRMVLDTDPSTLSTPHAIVPQTAVPLPEKATALQLPDAVRSAIDRQQYRRHSAGAILQEDASKEESPFKEDKTMNKDAPTSFMRNMWHYLHDEVVAEEDERFDEERGERISNFISIPQELEKLMTFGYFVCLDTFLYIFTVLPARVLYATLQFLWHGARWQKITPSQRCDLLRGCLILNCCYFLEYIDASQLYHGIRGQSMLKLYVIFNVLEICDRLCCSFGLDILDALFANASAASKTVVKSGPQLQPLVQFVLSNVYIIIHAMVFFYQSMTLNVAINSHNSALLSLQISNQFVEIKGSVFKKFEKENLFQLSCADAVERFTLSMFLVIITLRNLLELAGTSLFTFVPLFPNLQETLATQAPLDHRLFASLVGEPVSAYLPTSLTSLLLAPLPFFAKLQFPLLNASFANLWHFLLYPAVIVLGCEVAVDWLKHAFITKFNDLRPAVYRRFVDVLCKHLVSPSSSDKTGSDASLPPRRLIDRSPAVGRRIGFAAMPLACLVDFCYHACTPIETVTDGLKQVIRIGLQSLRMLSLEWNWKTAVLGLSFIIFMFLFKVMVGINLLGFAYRRHTQRREAPPPPGPLNEVSSPPKIEVTDGMSTPSSITTLAPVAVKQEKPRSLSPFHLPVKTDTSNKADKLESIDRYTLVRSRIP